MNDFDFLVIAPDSWAPDGNRPSELHTPYGAVGAQIRALGPLRAAWVAASAPPFAAVYAAKAAGATRVIQLAPATAHNRLLELGDLLLPSDLIDRTRLARYTFFAGKGYGFLAQHEPFCPDLRGALLAAAAPRAPRVFARGVYLATGEPYTVEPDWDADVAGSEVVPASFLARELELCYAVLCVVSEAPSSTIVPGTLGAREADTRAAGHDSALPTVDWLEALLIQALNYLPPERACVCAMAMQQYRERGDIGPDWRTWVAV